MRARLIAGTTSALLLATSAAGAAPPVAPPSPRPPAQAAVATAPTENVPQVVVSGDKLTRTVDCAGARAMVAASDGAVSLKHCLGIVVSGSHERVTAELMVYSDILVLGDHDVVRWKPAEGVSPEVRDQGHGNITAPL